MQKKCDSCKKNTRKPREFHDGIDLHIICPSCHRTLLRLYVQDLKITEQLYAANTGYGTADDSFIEAIEEANA